jgi:aspartyl/glutamyl-tRNA(Asn/Gln) amidotransferase C subunit
MASNEDVRKLAALARIRIADEALPSFAAEFESVLAYVGTLDELTLPSLDARRIPTVRNVFRNDGIPHEKGKYTASLVRQFPDAEGDKLRVKQIISHE